ncbi:polysaccharide ABC transporter ATP-binding protein [Cyclobacterium sp.]|uniref:ABC transporter ATP-binding protein n=1 Tax=Cyclobacterium sp. TaxID=1966343 RepID=UPI0019B51F89|nr:polysaccharide ABC transporter ATP-binding protein [Cyclobacterium sp.]MBD3627498.1 ATP-binding cassette domain-containing protein [Cyclobacterium sp.]
MATAIEVDNLYKAYQLGQYGTQTISGDFQRWWMTKVLRQEDPFLKIGEINDRRIKGESNVVWSLRNINFTVQQGEAFGIIGNNGAGKSTLLKLLSRVTSPTRGSIRMKGRVSSLLEVGTGFHPELSGKENIFLNGVILGMRKKEIHRRLDEIVDFAGVEKYLETPVKRYSSGMYVRLAFAVAAHLDAEILVVDEVLAVGDAEFQKKCLGKMNDISKNEGRTVLFVSHNIQAVSSLTNKAIILDSGELIFKGKTEDGISKYLGLKKTKSVEYRNESGEGIVSVSLKTSEPNNIHRFGQKFSVEIVVNLPQTGFKPAISYQVFDEFENPVFHELFLGTEHNFETNSGDLKIISEINNLRLYPGDYYLKIHYADSFSKIKIDTISDVCHFKVEVMEALRDYYWQPGVAKYVEKGKWKVL